VSASRLLLLLAAAALAPACAHVGSPPAFRVRPLVLDVGDRWIGSGICYGPHRDGQAPGGPSPTDAQLREDLALLVPRWTLIRIYGADEVAERLLAIIRSDRLPAKLLLGVWIRPERGAGPGPAVVLPEERAANRREVETAIRLANAYPEVVLAVVVGNETQVSWTAHKVDLDVLIGHVREVRSRTAVPVTSADDYSYWLTPESERLARELDLLVNHIHPAWNGTSLEGAVPFTQAKQAGVAARHPDRPVLLGEAGWPTRRSGEGDQAKLIKGELGEAEERAFFEQFTAWVTRERIPATFFEAFDENWKGGPHPDEVEKHWGLYRTDRTPKQALQGPR
jgi:exo-beta-1,3-glucanase (GH17 family)